MCARLRRPAGWGFLLLLSVGCAAHKGAETPDVPRELEKVSLPPYVIESPDILQINAIRLVPKPPYRIEPLDTLAVDVTNTLPNEPIRGIYSVEPDGRINLGFFYGSVTVQGMTIEQAKAAITQHLKQSLKSDEKGKPAYAVNVLPNSSQAQQLIRGPHLVQTDGTVNLGLYGAVYVDNLTIPQAKAAIEAHLSQFLLKPEIALTVAGYNSKVFYIITDGGGVAGEQIARIPVVGKTTVLDALGQLNGLPIHAYKHKISLVRPAPAGTCEQLVLSVDYKRIVQCGDPTTNYQILPGDRLYVKAAPLLKFDAYLARVLAPATRLLNFGLLTEGFISSTQSISAFGVNNGTTTTTTTTTR
jgi:polysaccharide export outer membrane protein